MLPFNSHMKSRLSAAILACAAVLIPVAVYATVASVSLSPTTGTLVSGTTKSVSIYVTPTDGAVYTAKVTIHFPSKSLHVQSFTPASGVITLSQPGYDLVDNAGGTLIKTVGFPKGVSSQTLVGTIVFVAAQAGDATVSVGSDSEALAVDNSNAATSFGSAHFTVTAAPVGTKKPTSQQIISAPALTPTTSVAEVAATTCSLFLSALGWLWILLAFIVGLFVGRKTARKSRKEIKKEARKETRK